MVRIVLALAAAVALSTAIGFAASMDVAPRVAASGSAPITPCGSVIDFELVPAGGDPGTVDAVHLTLDPACNQGSAFAALMEASTIRAVGGPGAISAGQATIDIEPDVPASEITHLRVSLVGP
jgi:hypothetical protein